MRNLLPKVIVCAVLFGAASMIQINYVTLDWGGYWAVDIVAPWHR